MSSNEKINSNSTFILHRQTPLNENENEV